MVRNGRRHDQDYDPLEEDDADTSSGYTDTHESIQLIPAFGDPQHPTFGDADYDPNQLTRVSYGYAHASSTLSAGSAKKSKRHRRSSSHGSTSTTSTTASSRTLSRPTTPIPSSPTFPPLSLPRARHYGCSLLTIVITIIAVSGLAAIMDSFVRFQQEPGTCVMSWMNPSYVPMTGFDSSFTRLAAKYSLYLYREGGVDRDVQPTGVPILFIPGNAGSFRQIRSIAASAARQYYSELDADPEAVMARGSRVLDFFTVDFNEDFSAFHGQTLYEQADYLNEAIKYILSLYVKTRRKEDGPVPSSVILLGHSMGGVVARTMLIRDNFKPGSVNSIITISTPHLTPPVAFDWLVNKIYADINDYWRRSYSAKYAYSNPLQDVTMVSIAGGTLDTVVCSDTANINSLVPLSHGFTVFTTSIPKVWTAIDHQCILWCDQFRTVIAKALLNSVDGRTPGGTKPRMERLASMQKLLLTGLEDLHLPAGPRHYSGQINLAKVPHTYIGLGQRLLLREIPSAETVHLMQIHGAQHSFNLLTDKTIGNSSRIEVLLCDVMPTEVGDLSLNARKVAAIDRDQLRLACDRPSKDAAILPASTRQAASPSTGRVGLRGETFSYLQFPLDEVNRYSYIAIVVHDGPEEKGFVVAEFYDEANVSEQLNVSMPELFFDGIRIEAFPDQPSLMSKLWIPAIDSSLIAYKMHVRRVGCEGPQMESLFSTLVRQSIPYLYESKFFTNVETASISLHGSAPFVTPVSGPHVRKGLELQFWTDPTCSVPLTVDIRMDYYGSLGKIVMRFRSALVAYPFVIVTFALRTQMREYNRGGVFIGFGEGLARFIRDALPNLLIIASFLSIFQSLIQAHTTYQLADLFAFDRDLLAGSAGAAAVVSTAPKKISNKGIDLLLGNNDPFFWFLVPLFLVLSVGVVAIMWVALATTVHLLAYLTRFVSTRMSFLVRYIARPHESEPSRVRRRLITTLVLFALVATFVPYQFAFIVAFFVQVISCVRAINRAEAAAQRHSLHASSSSSKVARHRDRANYLQSVLVLMLWLLPLNAPVLVVWIRNLSVHWLTPFSSDHNILLIAPIIFYVETVTSGKMLPRATSTQSIVSYVMLWYLGVYSLLYGVRYTYALYFLSLMFFTWLVAMHWQSVWFGRPLLRAAAEVIRDARARFVRH